MEVSSDVGPRRDVACRGQGFPGAAETGARPGSEPGRTSPAGEVGSDGFSAWRGRGGRKWEHGRVGVRLRTPGPAPLVRTRAEQPCGLTRRGIQWDVNQRGGRRAVCTTASDGPGAMPFGPWGHAVRCTRNGRVFESSLGVLLILMAFLWYFSESTIYHHLQN